MEYRPEQLYLIEYLLQETGRDISSIASKKFKNLDKVTAKTLFDFAADNALTFQIEEVRDSKLTRINILDLKERAHILALEFF
jgi:hypothetical protein